MSKRHKGDDEGGEYVLWTKEDGSMHKKYYDGPLKDEHQGYDPNTKRSFSTGCDRDWESNEDDSSGCYIATASLQGSLTVDNLLPLKQWRYDVLERWRLGMYLSEYYRRSASPIAGKVEQMPRVGRLLRNTFVKPALWLSIRNESWFRDAALFIIFLLGLTVANVIGAIKRT